jgi:hypothetical protein
MPELKIGLNGTDPVAMVESFASSSSTSEAELAFPKLRDQFLKVIASGDELIARALIIRTVCIESELATGETRRVDSSVRPVIRAKLAELLADADRQAASEAYRRQQIEVQSLADEHIDLLVTLSRAVPEAIPSQYTDVKLDSALERLRESGLVLPDVHGTLHLTLAGWEVVRHVDVTKSEMRARPDPREETEVPNVVTFVSRPPRHRNSGVAASAAANGPIDSLTLFEQDARLRDLLDKVMGD